MCIRDSPDTAKLREAGHAKIDHSIRWVQRKEDGLYLQSRYGVKMCIRDSLKAAACAKHFAVHSGPEGIRHEFNAVVSLSLIHIFFVKKFQIYF